MLFEAKAYKNPTLLLPLPQEYDIITIKAAQHAFESNQQKAAWIRGATSLISGQTKFWYASCVNCQKSVNADVNWMITCPSCKEYTQAEVRCRIAITLTDPTGTLECAIFGQDAEKLIPFIAAKLKEEDEKGTAVALQLADSIKKHTITCFLRSYDVEFRGQMQKRHSILKAYTLDESLSISQPAMHTGVSITGTSAVTSSLTSHTIVAESQMFTPTTKLVLEEIGGQTQTAYNIASTSTRVKRALFCTEETTNNEPSATELSSIPEKILPADHSPQVIPQTSALHKKNSEESPSKKVKDSLESL